MPIAQLADQMPEVNTELLRLVDLLERKYRDTQDFEFTVECGKLFLLQTRVAKRAALASVRIAADIVLEGMIDQTEAILRVKPGSLVDMLSPQLDLSGETSGPVTTGIPASPGAAVGMLALSANRAVSMHAEGKEVILLTEETTAEDIPGMDAAVGFLTARGGATSHAAVVARGMGKCCITGAKEISLNGKTATVRIGSSVFHEGDWLSLDGGTGRVFSGKVKLKPASEHHPELDQLLQWSLGAARCAVR